MKKVTSQQVAELAGVSQPTVSLILNESDQVTFSPETRERVFAAARQLGYRAPQRAGAKRGRSTRQLVILTPTLTNYYYTQVLQYSQSYAHELGYRIIVCNTFRDSEVERHYLDNLMKVDGILLTFLPSFPERINQLAERKPIVLIGEKENNLNVCSIELSNHRAGELIADHLIEQGHRRFVFVSTPLNRFSLSREQRLTGIRHAFRRRGLPEDAIAVVAPDGDNERESPLYGTPYEYDVGRRLTLDVLDKGGPRPTAFICVNDMTALGAMRAFEERRIAMPREVSVCGFDNIFPASITAPSLTTVDHQLKERCKAAIDMALTLYNAPRGTNPMVSKIEYAPLLIRRESTGPAPQA